MDSILLLIDVWFLLNTRLCWVVTWVSEPIMIHCVSRAESWEYGKQFQWSHDKTCSAQQTSSTNQARPVIFSQQCPVYVSGKLFCDHLFNKNYFTLDCQILCPGIFILLMTTCPAWSAAENIIVPLSPANLHFAKYFCATDTSAFVS